MNEPHDPNRTADIPSTPADSLDAGLAAGFGKASPPRSSLGEMRPVLLKEAEGESAHVVKPKSDAMPPPEQTGDRYQLQGEIARGGMGAVLRGRDVDLGRDLAIKVLLEKHAHRPEVVRRFIEEAQIGGQLQHPGVVPVYDIGRFGDRPFFTMKLVKGQTLAHLLAERADHTQDRPRFLAIALQVAQTVAYAHAKGVIHRDLKPANIMVGAFGEVQVMDWGLAKVLAEGGTADEEKASRQHQTEEGTQIRTARSGSTAGRFGTNTEAGSLLGTPAYMPPEQANGDVANLDRRADVFGLGAILCEILTGKPPYVGRSAEEVRRKSANGDQADAITRLAGCGADTELILLTKACLSAEAIDRPRDAHAVVDALTAYLDGVQERLRQAELARAAEVARAEEAQATAAQERKARQAAQDRAAAERRARRLTLALAATVLVALTLGGSGWLWVKADREARLAQVNREVSDALTQARAFRATDLSAAREQSQRALALVRTGPADPALAAQVEQLQADLDAEEKDRQLVMALDQARLELAGAIISEPRVSKEHLIPKFRAAFQAYGLEAGKGEPAAAVERIRQRPPAVREAIVAALDEWDEVAGEAKPGTTEPHREWLRGVLEAVEPAEAWNRRVRVARQEADPARRQAALVALAKSADVETTPASSLTRLADQLPQNPAAVELLRRAVQRYPGDFWVNCTLGIQLAIRRPPEWDEMVRFLTAAVALRPNSPLVQVNLGYALGGKGQVEEAIACFRKAVALDPKLGRAHHNLGALLVGKGKVDEAIACFRKTIEFDPKFAPTHNSLGVALRDKGQVEEAIACFRKAIELAAKFAPGHYNLGDVLKDRGQFDEAIACYRKAIDLDPKNAIVHCNLGYALGGKGQVEEAIACLHKAIELDPKYATPHNNLGRALHGQGRLEEAIAHYHKAIELDPKLAMAHTNLGETLSFKGRVDEAIACYRKAIEIDPKLAPAHFNLGNALVKKGQVDEAIACYQKAIDLDPKLVEAHFNLGNMLRGKGQVDEAIACFRKAIELNPKLVEGHLHLGTALHGKGKVKEAVACFQKAIALDPKDARGHAGLGNALKDNGQVDEAIAFYRKAIEIDAKCIAAYLNLAPLLFGKGKVEEAIACGRKAIALDPKNGRAHMSLGLALTLKGEVDEAIACFKKAIALDPKDPASHMSFGLALFEMGRVNEATVCWRKVIELDPKDATAHSKLGSVLVDRGQVDEAMICLRKAIALDPKDTAAHYGLANALRHKDRLDEAIASYKKAIELEPKFAEAHCNLGVALLQQGRFAESLQEYRRGHELGRKQPGWPYPSAQWVRQAERLAAMESKLPAFLKGEFQPKDTAQRLGLAGVCQAKKLQAAAVRLYADAFAADPTLADDVKAEHRYNAACAAALGAAGQGKDAARLDDKERARLRKQALDWLRAELAYYTKLSARGARDARSLVQQRMQHWLQDSDLAGLRDKAALAELPAEERPAWARLWSDVAALLGKAETPTPNEGK